MRSLQEAWSLFRLGPPEGFARRAPFVGQRFPVQALETLGQQFVPRWTTNGTATGTALSEVVQKVGPCILVCHSQGGESAFQVAADNPSLVKAIVALEPSGGFDCASQLRQTPVLLMLGDYFETAVLWAEQAQRLRRFSQSLVASGAAVTVDALPDQGIFGNSHMLMMDNNNWQLAHRVVDWLGRAGFGHNTLADPQTMGK